MIVDVSAVDRDLVPAEGGCVEESLADLTVGVELGPSQPGLRLLGRFGEPDGSGGPTAGLQKASPDSEWLAPVTHHASGPADPNPKAGLLSR